nr:hypothetical protein [Kibdelosporangium sp. MJ126-NF4]CEL19704.1 hypothetical protein [Kibdelosporangium sp. MJ126-NF4]CTQ96930.1 hypothetical protein [Kibdelosporangium sp. MJ126-NF4]
MSANIDKVLLRRAAMMWAFVVQLQADRLYESVSEFNTAAIDQEFLDARAKGRLPDDWKPYVQEKVGSGLSWAVAWTAGADHYFFLSAAAQLHKCVSRLSDDGLPEPPNARMIMLLRNFTEHWEDPAGRSAVELRTTIPDAVPGRLAYTKHDIEIEGVSMYGIVEWSTDAARQCRANRRELAGLEPTRRT